MTRVAIAAASDVARASMAAVISALDGLELVARASDADALARAVRIHAPDVILIEVERGGDALLQFVGALPEIPRPPGVVVLSDEPIDATPLTRRHITAWAQLPRRADAAEIDAAVLAVAAGLIVTHPMLAERTALPLGARGSHDGSVLTPREIEVLGMLAAGLPNKAIAKRLGVSAHTVKFHVGSIMTKLHASSRTEAVTDGIRRGLIFI